MQERESWTEPSPQEEGYEAFELLYPLKKKTKIPCYFLKFYPLCKERRMLRAKRGIRWKNPSQYLKNLPFNEGLEELEGKEGAGGYGGLPQSLWGSGSRASPKHGLELGEEKRGEELEELEEDHLEGT